jgi:hypothetical protein
MFFSGPVLFEVLPPQDCKKTEAKINKDKKQEERYGPAKNFIGCIEILNLCKMDIFAQNTA